MNAPKRPQKTCQKCPTNDQTCSKRDPPCGGSGTLWRPLRRSQKPFKIDAREALEATWGPCWKPGASKTSILTVSAPFWDPLRDHVAVILGCHFFDVFLRWSFDGFCLHLGSQKTPKWYAAGGQNPDMKITDFVVIYYISERFVPSEVDPKSRKGLT